MVTRQLQNRLLAGGLANDCRLYRWERGGNRLEERKIRERRPWLPSNQLEYDWLELTNGGGVFQRLADELLREKGVEHTEWSWKVAKGRKLQREVTLL